MGNCDQHQSSTATNTTVEATAWPPLEPGVPSRSQGHLISPATVPLSFKTVHSSRNSACSCLRRQAGHLFLNPEILFCLYSLVGNRITCFLCLPQLRPRRLSSATLYIMALMSMIPSPRRCVVLLSLSLTPTLVAAVNPATSTKAAAADYYVRDLPGLPADGPKVNMHAG